MCDVQIDDSFGSPTRIPLDVKYLFVHGVAGPSKWRLLGKFFSDKSGVETWKCGEETSGDFGATG